MTEDKFVPIPGTLYVVGTPIGNLGDFSPRAVAVCAAVDGIAAEDTRLSGRLLQHFGIRTRLISFHEHNTKERIADLVPRLLDGQTLALISDAGMPCISDPGAELVAACHEQGIQVVVVPGPSALVTALAGSGLPTQPFYFEGFLPVKGKERRERLALLRQRAETTVFYEAPHRLERTLQDFHEHDLGERRLVVARELTKRYEEFAVFTVDQALAHYAATPPKGEFVLVLAGTGSSTAEGPAGGRSLSDARRTDIALGAQIARLLLQGCSVKDIVSELSAAKQDSPTCNHFAVPMKRNELYNLVQEVKQCLQGDCE